MQIPMWKHRPLNELIVIPVDAQADPSVWYTHALEFDELYALEDFSTPLGGAWIWDQDDQTLVAAVFDPSLWDESAASAWVQAEMSGDLSDPVPDQVPADDIGTVAQAFAALRKSMRETPNVLYFRKLIARLRKHVSEEDFGTAVRGARAYAGGRAKAQKQDEGADDGLQHAETVTDPAQPEGSEAPVALAIGSGTAHSRAPYIDPASGYIWKCISRLGRVRHPLSGKELEVTDGMFQSVLNAFGKVPQYVDIPLGHHLDKPEANTGFVRQIERRGNELWGALDFTEPEYRAKVERGTIPDVSVWFQPQVTHPDTGEKFDWALMHVALTGKPLMTELGAFALGDATADVFEAVEDPHLEDSMEPTPEQIAQAIQTQFGMSAEQLQAAVAAAAQAQTLQEQLDAQRPLNRQRHVDQLVLSLEGKLTLDGVTQIAGYRHFPATIEAVKQSLSQHEALAMSINLDGTCPALDSVVLSLVNALPAEARMPEAGPALPKTVETPAAEPVVHATDGDAIAALNALIAG